MKKRAAFAWRFFSLPLVLLCISSFSMAHLLAADAPPATVPKTLATDQAGAPEKKADAKPEDKEGHVSLRVALSHDSYTQTAPQHLLLKVDFADTDHAPPERPPLNLALVLDRSGSMAEENKFAFTIQAAREVIENLTDRDILSIVVYNDRAMVLSPAGRVVNKAYLNHRLADVTPEGLTDLSAGLLEGMAQVNSKSAEGQLKQIFLLTDGLANRGVSNQAGLRRIVERARAKGIAISTLGCGAEFNEKILQDMAGAGGGRYLYVKSPEQIPNAFQEELRGAVQVVAQNARLEITVTNGAIRKVYGEVLDGPVVSHQVNIGNLRAGERGVVLLALKPGMFQGGGQIQATVKLTFDDPESGERVVRELSRNAAFAPGAPRDKPTPEQEEVVLYGAIFEALESATMALASFDQERYDTARAGFNQAHERARQHALVTRNQDLLNQAFLLKHFMQELDMARAAGKLHGHANIKSRLEKESDYQRYLLFHHNEPPGAGKHP